MTVEELIEELKKCPQHYTVLTKVGFVQANDKIVDGIKFPGGANILITSHIVE